MHVVAIVFSAGLYIAGLVCIFIALSQTFELQAEVNAKLPEGKKFEPLFWSLVTRSRLRELQRQVLPDSTPRKIELFVWSGIILLLSASALVYMTV